MKILRLPGNALGFHRSASQCLVPALNVLYILKKKI